jgi:hypothetical protein
MHALLRSASLALVLTPSLLLTGCLSLDGKAERAFTASEPKPVKLVIESRFLDIDLVAASGDTVGVSAKVTMRTTGGNETAEREIETCTVHVDREGDTLFIRQGRKGVNPSVMSWSGSGSLRVSLPAGVPFQIDSAAGDVHATGDYGRVPASIAVASGDVTGTFGVASLSVDSASGDTMVTILGALDSLKCDSASGDIAVKAPSIATGALDSASGDIDCSGAAGPFKLAAASGDIHLTFVAFPAEAITSVSSASGDILLLLPAGSEPSGSLSTASGSITLGVPGTKARGLATLTGSGAKITVSAASGDVKVTTPQAK